MKEHMKLLGLRVSDRVTKFEGIVTTIAFDLYGCVQAIVTPPAIKGELVEGRWFDTKRLEVFDSIPIMKIPTFETIPGGSNKSLPPSSPLR